ncbi:hypothetical protein B0A48_11922 [Cryoendolithus antarcticus]|uniref:IEC3 subunit of the Ino80 complex, chromatin re-modelling-domain-containing protein n=1 Tax=Cryoendolithus antarcticus TaxID=1507870 RepID=A0A1V8STN4_9PEZI|nr:hypothetical protein B0A48_11922 [Cryoendolithus antarcticus]
MSATDNTPPLHPNLGGKTIANLPPPPQAATPSNHPPYKSWRKKYRKIRTHSDAIQSENHALYKTEHKLEHLAKRLREELDHLLETLLEINQSPVVPAELRFDVRLPSQRSLGTGHVRSDISLQEADEMVGEYTIAVQHGRIPPLDLAIIREQVQEALASQGVVGLEALEARVPAPIVGALEDLPLECRGNDAPGYMSAELEAEFYARLDASLETGLGFEREGVVGVGEVNQADMTPRELERQMELQNPMSQHNWLKNNTKAQEDDDANSVVSVDGWGKPVVTKKRPGKNLAKQVGDRAVERAREVGSPSAASGFEDDEHGVGSEDLGGSGKKRKVDGDGAFKAKSRKSGGEGGGKGKRKRATEEGVAGSASASAVKKVKVGEE